MFTFQEQKVPLWFLGLASQMMGASHFLFFCLPLFLFFVSLLIPPIPLYLPSFSPSFLLVYPTNHVLVLKGQSTDISHTKYLIFIPAQPDLISCLFLKTKLQHVKGKLRTLVLPYHELQLSSRRQNNWSPGSLLGGLCWSTLLTFQN